MKKIYTLFFGLIVGSSMGSFAQTNGTPAQAPLKDQGNQATRYKLTTQQNVNRAASDRWYNFGSAMDLFNQGSGVLYSNNLFPDTTILVDYGTSGYSGPWIHKLADVLDVKSDFFNDPNTYPNELNTTTDFLNYYDLDSIAVYFLYTRGINDPNIVDTLLIEVAKSGSLPTSYFGSNAPTLVGNLNTDTVFFKDLPYSQPTNEFPLAGKFSIKVPLTAATEFDTLPNGLNYIAVPVTGLTGIPDNNLVVSSIGYIPGYTWTANLDTLDSKNACRFISYKEIDGQFFNYTKRDWNSSYIVPEAVRYDNAGGWNGSFIPAFAYMGGAAATYNYEHHLIEYKISAGLVGLNDKSENGFAFNSAPNPADNNVIVTVNIADNSLVNFQITDITGKIVMSQNLGNLGQGNYREAIETSQLANGLYNLTFTVNGVPSTKKLTVQH
jgi:hypothetical protein